MTIRWEEITYHNMNHLDKVLKIYDQAFPIEVREQHNTFISSLKYASEMKPNSFRFLVGLEGEEIVSFATGHYLAKVNTGFVVYIATNPSVQSRGIGAMTLSKLEELLNQDSIMAGNNSLRALFLETEKQEIVQTVAEKEDCSKRNRFFIKNGYKKFEEINYLQPPLHNGEGNVPLNLLIKESHKNSIKLKEIIETIIAIYKEKYYLINGIDKKILEDCLKEMGIVQTIDFPN